VTVDFATMAQRRLSKAPVEQGGWSAFITGWTGGDILNPAVNPMLRGGGQKAFPGWADDPELEALRHQWASAADPAERSRLATAIQVQAFKTLPYLPLGGFFSQCAYRSDVTGVFPAPVAAYWNIGKKA
jgi:peptide/nickel transport system substrate-binding protein